MWDMKTFPLGLTNLDELHEVVSKKYAIGGMGITLQDINEILDEKKIIALPNGLVIDLEEVSKHIFTKGARANSFNLSAIRRLVEEVDSLKAEIAILKVK